MGKDILGSSRSEFSRKFLANNFVLSDAENNTFGPFNTGGIADHSPHTPAFLKVGLENFRQRPKGGREGRVEIFKKGVKEWERWGCSKKGGLEDGEDAGGGHFAPPLPQ